MPPCRRLAAWLLVVIAPLAAAGELCRAIDGDTIRCGAERVRLMGIHAPERGEPGYERARARLAARLEAGEVTIERRGRDRWGRTLGIVRVNGRAITQRAIGASGGR